MQGLTSVYHYKTDLLYLAKSQYGYDTNNETVPLEHQSDRVMSGLKAKSISVYSTVQPESSKRLLWAEIFVSGSSECLSSSFNSFGE